MSLVLATANVAMVTGALNVMKHVHVMAMHALSLLVTVHVTGGTMDHHVK